MQRFFGDKRPPEGDQDPTRGVPQDNQKDAARRGMMQGAMQRPIGVQMPPIQPQGLPMAPQRPTPAMPNLADGRPDGGLGAMHGGAGVADGHGSMGDGVITPEKLIAPFAPKIGREEINKATALLQKYRDGKKSLEDRIVNDELWYVLRHWEAIGKHKRSDKEADGVSAKPTSAWLFNSILNKHADAMDNFPEPVVMPREMSDEASAKVLSDVLPVIYEHNDYEETYSAAWWEKLKHGTAVYGIFWNPSKENGLGDIDIKSIDMLKLFWEPGIQDIQKSRNLFILDLVDTDTLNEQYPEYDGELGGNAIEIKEYITTDNVDNTDKSVVVDWYYKTQSAGGRTVLHYAKFVGSQLLFASENEPEYQDIGWYDDGEYPVVFDTLFPEKATPAGFGYIAMNKEPQMYIDHLAGNILTKSMQDTRLRFLVSNSTNINEQEFLDWSKPFIHVEGQIDDARVREMEISPLSGVYLDVMNQKIEEMKDTTGNRDVNSGGVGSGVTAAAAIAALQEAGNKTSRDIIAASYRAHVRVSRMVIERIRQFYDETRSFRITGSLPGAYEFVELNNQGLRDQDIGTDSAGTPMFRRPVFDLDIRSQKNNPFSKMEQNERAKELYAMGFFNPDRAQEAQGAIEMMDFEGIEQVREHINQGQTLMNVLKEMSQVMQQQAQIISALQAPMTGMMPSASPQAAAPDGGAQGGQASAPPQSSAPSPFGGLAQSASRAQSPMSPYGQKLAQRSTPKIDAPGTGATPR